MIEITLEWGLRRGADTTASMLRQTRQLTPVSVQIRRSSLLTEMRILMG